MSIIDDLRSIADNKDMSLISRDVAIAAIAAIQNLRAERDYLARENSAMRRELDDLRADLARAKWKGDA